MYIYWNITLFSITNTYKKKRVCNTNHFTAYTVTTVINNCQHKINIPSMFVLYTRYWTTYVWKHETIVYCHDIRRDTIFKCWHNVFFPIDHIKIPRSNDCYNKNKLLYSYTSTTQIYHTQLMRRQTQLEIKKWFYLNTSVWRDEKGGRHIVVFVVNTLMRKPIILYYY